MRIGPRPEALEEAPAGRVTAAVALHGLDHVARRLLGRELVPVELVSSASAVGGLVRGDAQLVGTRERRHVSRRPPNPIRNAAFDVVAASAPWVRP